MRSEAISPSRTVWLLAPPIAAVLLLWITRRNDVTLAGALYAFLLLLVPWISFLSWRHQNQGGLPVFAMLGFTYWWWFVPALFWLDRTLWVGRRNINPENVDGAVLMALVGVICMGVGRKLKLTLLSPTRQLELAGTRTSWFYVRLILILGTLGTLFSGTSDFLGTNGRQIMEILISTVPTVALLLLLRKCLVDPRSKFDRALLLVYFPVRILAGLSSGWVGSVVSLGVICGVMYILIRKRAPWVVITLITVAVLFLEVGKKDFRYAYWYGGAEGGFIEKAAFWLNASTARWSAALASQNVGSTGHLSSESLARSSLLPQVAHVLDVTPTQIPFQEGRTYSYMAVALIPRFLWPDKPSVNDANRYYQIVFGLSTKNDINRVNIGAGCLAESYINFGWTGVTLIMFGIGIILGIYERSFLSPQSSTLFLAIGIALLPNILGIESQMSAYLGGVIQTVLLTILVFLPVLRKRSAPVMSRARHNSGMFRPMAQVRDWPVQ